jgi:chromosome segregation ATPase
MSKNESKYFKNESKKNYDYFPKIDNEDKNLHKCCEKKNEINDNKVEFDCVENKFIDDEFNLVNEKENKTNENITEDIPKFENKKKEEKANNINNEIMEIKNERINLKEKINLIINPENKLSKLNKELKDLNEETKTVEEIIYYKELDKNIIYQIILKNKDNNLEIYINNYSNKPHSNYFSSFSLETLQKNNYFKLFNSINSFLFEIKDLINNSFIYLDTPKNESESIFLNIPLNIIIIDKILFEIKKVENDLSDINKDLLNYIEILEKEKENYINIIKKLNKICFEDDECINDINNDLSKDFDILESKKKNLNDIQKEKNNIIDNFQKYIEKTNKLIDFKENEFNNFKKQLEEIQNKINLKIERDNIKTQYSDNKKSEKKISNYKNYYDKTEKKTECEEYFINNNKREIVPVYIEEKKAISYYNKTENKKK